MLRSFLLRYLSNAYDRLTSSFSDGIFADIFLPNLLKYVGEVVLIGSERIPIGSEVVLIRSERGEIPFGGGRNHVPDVIKYPSERG